MFAPYPVGDVSTGEAPRSIAAAARIRPPAGQTLGMATTTQKPKSRPSAGARTPSATPEPVPGKKAAEQVGEKAKLHLRLPLLGNVDLPPADALAFAAGLTLMAVAGAIEWPVAGLIGLGHYLSQSRQSSALRDFGAALEDG